MVKGLKNYCGSTVLGYRVALPRLESRIVTKGLVLNGNKPNEVRYTQENYNYSKKLKKVTYNGKRKREFKEFKETVFVSE